MLDFIFPVSACVNRTSDFLLGLVLSPQGLCNLILKVPREGLLPELPGTGLWSVLGFALALKDLLDRKSIFGIFGAAVDWCKGTRLAGVRDGSSRPLLNFKGDMNTSAPDTWIVES